MCLRLTWHQFGHYHFFLYDRFQGNENSFKINGTRVLGLEYTHNTGSFSQIRRRGNGRTRRRTCLCGSFYLTTAVSERLRHTKKPSLTHLVYVHSYLPYLFHGHGVRGSQPYVLCVLAVLLWSGAQPIYLANKNGFFLEDHIAQSGFSNRLIIPLWCIIGEADRRTCDFGQMLATPLPYLISWMA